MSKRKMFPVPDYDIEPTGYDVEVGKIKRNG